MNYYKVKIGFGKDDYISIDETEVAKAMTAQITGKVGIFNQGTIAGNNIISITPDWNRVMGWKRDYQLTGEDYDQIGESKQTDSRILLENTKARLFNEQRLLQ